MVQKTRERECGGTKEGEFTEFYWNIYNLPDIAENYILQNMKWKSEIIGTQREEIPEIRYSYEMLEHGFKFILYRSQHKSDIYDVTLDVTLNGTEMSVLAILRLLLHDIGESYTGDIAATQKTDNEKFEEQQITRAIFMSSTYSEVSSLTYYKDIWDEFIKNSTINAKLAHEIDKIENLVQILIYRKAGENFKFYGCALHL